MKNIKYILAFALSISFFGVNGQEKKIKFSKGTLKICSSKNFTITGYDGKEVIIKSLHEKRNSNFFRYRVNSTNAPGNFPRVKGATTISRSSRGSNSFSFHSSNDSLKKGRVVFFSNDGNRKEGLKRLGKKSENKDLGIYFTIEQKNGELIFKDQTEGQLVMVSNERYEIKIPNSIKLNWHTNGCDKVANQRRNRYVFFNSKASSLSNFNGEVEISTSLNNMKLVDVTGPVSINSIGGNVTIEFDKKEPKKLYSIYSNNGFIDVTLPSKSDVTVDTNSASIYSDIDFNVLEDKEEPGAQKMKLKLNKGNVKMKLNAGLGNIYLRKK
ncbi:hypothetical protein [uncultured Polaribacter sp.]|uniref:hypothetical protein n=1 Tax=uncultured Polaribacter sp. TaxID=174711 RepID=UPI00259BC8A3|nr:hypothetical protein [uncultured Polaribacter sp.]